MKDEKTMKELALFRFSLIAPVVSETYREISKMEYFRVTSEKSYVLPNGKEATFSPATIKNWYLKYKKGGLNSLIPKGRIDLGRTRSLSKDACNQILAYKEAFPYITGKKIYHKLIEEGYIKATNVSLNSIYRYLTNNNLTRNHMPAEQCLAYEMKYANDCWQADTTRGPVIIVNEKKIQTYLIVFIDDASRVITHGELFFNDDAINMQTTFKKAMLKFGIPKRIFLDNGTPYKNNQLEWICAELGIVKIHSKPYFPQGSGKIERSHRTTKDKWMNSINWNDYSSLEALNKDYQVFLDKEYTNSIHSSLKTTPKERYLQDFDLIKFISEEELEESFLHRVTRKVTSTATISLFKNIYEVPQYFIGTTVNIRYSPDDLSEIYVYDGITNDRLNTCYYVNKQDNAKVKRKPNINYVSMDGGKDYV